MSEEIGIPDALKSKVLTIGASVTSEETLTYVRIQESNDRSAKLRKILDAWERQHTEERKLRQTYGKALLTGLFIQGGLVNLAFFAIGCGRLTVDPWVANSFIIAVFGEIAGMTFFIIKYLFPKVSADVLATLEKL